MTSTLTTQEVAWIIFAFSLGETSVFALLFWQVLQRLEKIQAELVAVKRENERLDRQMLNYLAFGRPERETPAALEFHNAGDVAIGGDATARDHINQERRGNG